MSLKVISDKEYDYDDVLIKPNRSFQVSRSDVKVERDFKFYHSNREWYGCPIMISPMPYLANFNIADTAAKHQVITCLHKFYSNEELFKYFL